MDGLLFGRHVLRQAAAFGIVVVFRHPAAQDAFVFSAQEIGKSLVFGAHGRRSDGLGWPAAGPAE
ncbi:hypothetical protein [Cupriavidus pauculus]|uniref:Uncharacterized protein n=1 Tax=Cupriavidus pauculus TaxID=82633 RepID=A0A2N5C609_9BURK|nr:hypothetical protein [Cupriavidus pauculus]PLP97617.1 hypothetical protein CYJ10_26005 [Cupriavidus pauculus]